MRVPMIRIGFLVLAFQGPRGAPRTSQAAHGAHSHQPATGP